MDQSALFLLEHGYILLFLWVLADQVGLPLPVFPLLLGAGALAGRGEVRLVGTVAVAGAASALGGQLWYEVGRRRGRPVLDLLCRVSLEPDSCVRQSEDVFARYSRGTLIVAKFVPGLSAVAAPMVGVFVLPRLQFLLLP